MMKKYLFLAGIATLSLASCNNDATVELNDSLESANQIKFSVRTENNTRAANVFCANNAPSSLSIYAAAGATGSEKLLLNGLSLSSTTDASGNTTWSYTGTYYFPAGKSAFYAYSGETPNTWTSYGSAPTVTFNLKDKVSEQVDFMYGVKKFDDRPSDGKVELNLRHALSQIVFKAKNTNKNLHVIIEEVSVGNVHSSGTYTLPTVSTDGQNTDHNQSTTTDNGSSSRGSWALTGDGSQKYTVEVLKKDNAFQAVTTDGINLTDYVLKTEGEGDDETSTDNGLKASDFNKAMLLFPETNTTKWDVTTVATSGATAPTSGTFFAVKCKIYNVSGTTFDATNDVQLWGDNSGNAKEIWIPASFNWSEGKKYTYTFVFGTGNGGYNPDDNEPVLVPISFECTIDDFIKGEAADTEMKTNETNN